MMAGALIAVADQFRDLGLTTATVQKEAISEHEASNAFWLSMAVGLALATIFAASSPLIALYYKDQRVVPITCALALNLILGSLTGQHQALLTRQIRIGETAFVRLVASVLSTSLAIALAFYGFEAWSLVWREISRWLFIAMGMWFILPWIPSLPRKSVSIRAMLGYGMNLTGANMLGLLSGTMDRFLLGRLWGPDTVASYRQGHQLLSAPADQIVSPIYQAAQPALSRLQNEQSRFKIYFLKTVGIVAILTMPSSLFLGVFSSEITGIFLGPKWHSVAPVISVLSIGVFARQTIGSSAIVLISLGRTATQLRLSACSSIVSIAFALMGARFGLLGLAVADVAAVYSMAIPRLYITFRESPITLRDFALSIRTPTVASAVSLLAMGTISFLYRDHSNATRLFAAGIFAPMSFIAAYFLFEDGRSQARAYVGYLKDLALKRRAQ
jgi:PST family polysaccharide transporter